MAHNLSNYDGPVPVAYWQPTQCVLGYGLTQLSAIPQLHLSKSKITNLENILTHKKVQVHKKSYSIMWAKIVSYFQPGQQVAVVEEQNLSQRPLMWGEYINISLGLFNDLSVGQMTDT